MPFGTRRSKAKRKEQTTQRKDWKAKLYIRMAVLAILHNVMHGHMGIGDHHALIDVALQQYLQYSGTDIFNHKTPSAIKEQLRCLQVCSALLKILLNGYINERMMIPNAHDIVQDGEHRHPDV